MPLGGGRELDESGNFRLLDENEIVCDSCRKARRLPEKRSFPRHRRRLLVEWAAEGFASAGFTHDVSPTGMFICSVQVPEREIVLPINLTLPDGRKIRLRGVIVRSYRVAPSLRRARRSGFCVRLIEAPEEYFVLLADLLNVQLPGETA